MAGLFSKIFGGLSKIDDDFYEEIFEKLVMGDVGVRTSEEIVEKLTLEQKVSLMQGSTMDLTKTPPQVFMKYIADMKSDENHFSWPLVQNTGRQILVLAKK